MSPSQFHDYHHLRRELNGPRPTPLKINKDSHSIQKPSSSTSSSTSASSSLSVAAAAAKQSQSQQQQRHPVIIYTHSPKIIHTQARDFMALVQKLTGLSRSDDPAPPHPPESEAGAVTGHDDSASPSVPAAADENCVAPPVFDPPNPFLSEVPLFTPSPMHHFASSGPLYRYPDSVFSPPTMSKSISHHLWRQ
ncbi:hypothetical protein ACLOJK_001311 [Asimina triloba]